MPRLKIPCAPFVLGLGLWNGDTRGQGVYPLMLANRRLSERKRGAKSSFDLRSASELSYSRAKAKVAKNDVYA
jgi:hypothetical protein